MDHRVRSRGSGCPVHKKQLLPVLVVLAPPRKKRKQEQHALNGSTSASTAGSPPRSVRQRVDLANDDDLEPTLVSLRPRRACDRTGCALRPSWVCRKRARVAWIVSSREGGSWRAPLSGRRSTSWSVAATEAHRRHILTTVPNWHNRPVILQHALGDLAVYNLRPSDYTPVEEVNILSALEGDLHMRAHNGALFTYHRFS